MLSLLRKESLMSAPLFRLLDFLLRSAVKSGLEPELLQLDEELDFFLVLGLGKEMTLGRFSYI